MRNKVFLFNPDHDLALANHDVNYMPPASARQFSADLAIFPAWYAGGQHMVLAPSAYNLTFLNEMRVRFPRLASLLTEVEVAMTLDVDYIPWGWDPAVHKRFIQLGVPLRSLPSQEQLTLIREKSHRLQAVELLKRLQFSHCCGESFYLTELGRLKEFVETRTACLLKAPLSGSGKGLNWCKGVFTTHISDWCKNIIRQQGGVVAEPLYDKVIDFAMQFYAYADGQVRFSGYSFFHTTNSGAYDGNLLATDDEIESQLIKYIPFKVLDEVRHALEKELSGLIDGVYVGYLGVDMMICRSYDALEYRLHPCVEINLRMNMGMASRIFYDNYVQIGKKGVLKVSYYASSEQLQEEHKRMVAGHPLVLENGRIVRGYLSLVPVTPRAKYGVWVLIDDSTAF
ncbi:hypothetical protein [Bacteroides sp. 51]|uniref:hypothetical protein n=1 Tax=Bacteroides sp. 51 TaxID=2302938 RepID=UPI0013D0750C|nr:hypothetical protein [Bacteroides sp. 51]NDV82803.1 hypothetical protein [Bacteroides sp. 51]